MDQINVMAELENIGLAYEFASDDELRVRCPFHDDSKPSLLISTSKRIFHCPVAGCEAHGDFVTFLARYLKVSRADVVADLSTRYVLDSTKLVEVEVIEKWHEAIWNSGPLLKALYDRGITDAMIRKYRLGIAENRITIPIKNESGHYVNVRKYLPGAPGAMKMRNMRGRAKPMRLYPVEQLRYDKIVVTGGEMKALAAIGQLNKQNIGCVTATGGEGNWEPHLTQQLAGKTIWVCLDIDEPGRLAAASLCGMLYNAVSWVGDMVLPLDRDKYPKGDINDFIHWEKGNLLEVIEATPEWKPLARRIDETDEPVDVTLSQAVHADNTGRRSRMRVMAAAVDTAPYTVPAEVQVTCTRDQPMCAFCPVFAAGPQEQKWRISPEHPAILHMVSATAQSIRPAIMLGLDVPQDCKVSTFKPISYYNVEDARLSPRLEIANRVTDRSMQPALLIGDGVELNEPYVMVGRMHPHPKTQQSTLLVSAYDHAQDALSSYKCDTLDELQLFQPTQWTTEGLKAKLDDLYEDLAANVTRIYQREDLHLTIDLAYHSPLMLELDGQEVKGWVETLVVGDSAQGKTETALGLMRHYGLGERVDCKNATVAGLLGGLQQIGTRWFVSWGVIPTHDKRLVFLEELKGANTEVIAKLTDMRSSGVAEIPKIEKRRTHARTRLVALSNPRSTQKMAAYNFGIDAIKELIGNLEDVRRFDMALIVAAQQLDPSILNVLQRHRPVVEHRHTSDLCRSLVLWCWTRTTSQVIFPDDTTAAILQAATSLSDSFTDQVPLVDRGSMRNKLARLSAALAGRTFSCSEDQQSILVRPCHVEYIAAMLKRIYSDPVFGYADLTEAVKLTTILLDPEIVKRHVRETPFPKDFIKQMLHTTEIELVDIQDWCGWNRIEAQALLSLLVRKHAVVRDDRHYRKTPSFIQLLKKMLEDSDYPDRPDFIKEEF